MLGPDSLLLIALLIAASAALLTAAVRLRPLAVTIACGALTIVVAMTGGIAAVNHYYGYYTTWGQLWADYHGGTGDLGVIPAVKTSAIDSGRIGWADLPGPLSGYSRRGLVYLPPQYGQARYARVRFPVVELFHGTPGSPLAWDTVLRIRQVADVLLARHLIGPMVLVMPAINGAGHDYQDCVNGPAVHDDTYLTQDVRADVLARYRVSDDPYEWGAAGYSSGGFCAAGLALRHRTAFGAAAVIEGYFRAADGPAAGALRHSSSLEAANSPLYLAERLKPDNGPVPAFWVAARGRRQDRLPDRDRVRGRDGPHSAGPLCQALVGRLRGCLGGDPAGRPHLAVAAAGPARPEGSVPRGNEPEDRDQAARESAEVHPSSAAPRRV